MRGSPLVRGFLVFVGVLSLGAPLRILTRETPPEPQASRGGAPQAATEAGVQLGKAELELIVDFSRPARRLEVLYLGKSVLSLEGPSAREERRLGIEFPKEGVEFLVRVEFEGEGTSAVRLRLKSPEGEVLDRSAWGGGRLEEVLAFP